jgi:hypothetical protein
MQFVKSNTFNILKGYLKNKKVFLLVFFAFIFFLLLVFVKSKQGVLLFGDLDFSLFIKEGLKNNSYVWYDYKLGNYDYSNLASFPLLLIFKVVSNLSNIYFTSNFLFFGLYFGIFLSSIYLIKNISKNPDFLDYLIVSIYAVANPLIFTLIGQVLPMAYSLICVNLFLGYFFKLNNELRFKDVFLLILIILLCNAYLQTTLLLLLVIFFYFLIVKFKTILNKKRLFLSSGLLFIALNLFWLIFLIYQIIGNQSINSSMNYDPQSSEGIGIAEYMTKTIKTFNPFMLASRYETASGSITSFYSNPYVIFILLAITAFLIFSYFSRAKDKEANKERRFILFLFIIYIIFYSFSLGVYFRKVFLIFWNYFPLFDLYRSIHKFLFPLFFISIILFAHSLNKIKGRRKTKIVILILIFPLLFSFIQKIFIKSTTDYKIPDYYFSFNSEISKSKEDSIIKIIPETNWYVKFEWNGDPSGNMVSNMINNKRISYNFAGYSIKTFSQKVNNLLSASLVSCDDHRDIQKMLGLLNMRKILLQKDVDVDPKKICVDNIEKSGLKKYSSMGKLDVYKLDDYYFIPHFYTPKNIIMSKRTTEELPRILSQDGYNIRSAIFFENQNTDKAEILNQIKDDKDEKLPIIEFKKINPTKYRIRVHRASGVFPLVFSESFNEGWKTYLSKIQSASWRTKSKIQNLNDYKILDGNLDDQATKEELASFIKSGYITTLGDGKEKISTHKKWVDMVEKTDYVEKYKIDYISKNFQGTIQNDNLPSGNIFETWFKKPIDNNANHLTANGYANSWVINPQKLCAPSSPQPSPQAGEGASGCVKNSDGTYDFEMVVEFWPQRLFYIGLFISGATLLGCLAYLGYNFAKKRKTN